MIQEAGNSPLNDQLRDEIEKEYPAVTILDVPCHYDIEVFNRCEEEGCLLLSLESWKEVHPSLVSVPLNVNHTIPYGIIYSAKAGQEIRHFLQILQKEPAREMA